MKSLPVYLNYRHMIRQSCFALNALRFVTLCLLLLTGCIGETDCPEYPESKLSWLPYRIKKTIKFTNNNDTIKFFIKEASTSDEYSFKNNCKCECEANALFKTNFDTTTDMRIEGYSNFYGNQTYYQYRFLKIGENANLPSHNDDFYFSDPGFGSQDEVIPEYTVGDKTYRNVRELKLDTTDWSKPEIWRVIIADSVGIIQFDDRKTGMT